MLAPHEVPVSFAIRLFLHFSFAALCDGCSLYERAGSYGQVLSPNRVLMLGRAIFSAAVCNFFNSFFQTNYLNMYQAICCLQSNAFQWGNNPKIAPSHGDTGSHPVHSSRGLPKYTTRMAAQFMVVSSIRYRRKHRETTLHLTIYNANIFTKYDQLHFTL